MIQKKLLDFQRLNITLKKDGLNPHFNSAYVTLNEVLDKVKKPLNDLGILIIQSSEATGLRTVLKDTEDESQVEAFMPYTETSTAQKLGSNLTYLRRYSLVTLLGLEDADDDGNKASEMPTYTRRGENVVKMEHSVGNTQTSLVPKCKHGPMRRVQTKKPGANQGRFFYACSQPQGAPDKCDSFVWEDEWLAEKQFKEDKVVYDEEGELEESVDGKALPF